MDFVRFRSNYKVLGTPKYVSDHSVSGGSYYNLQVTTRSSYNSQVLRNEVISFFKPHSSAPFGVLEKPNCLTGRYLISTN